MRFLSLSLSLQLLRLLFFPYGFLWFVPIHFILVSVVFFFVCMRRCCFFCFGTILLNELDL